MHRIQGKRFGLGAKQSCINQHLILRSGRLHCPPTPGDRLFQLLRCGGFPVRLLRLRLNLDLISSAVGSNRKNQKLGRLVLVNLLPRPRRRFMWP